MRGEATVNKVRARHAMDVAKLDTSYVTARNRKEKGVNPHMSLRILKAPKRGIIKMCFSLQMTNKMTHPLHLKTLRKSHGW